MNVLAGRQSKASSVQRTKEVEVVHVKLEELWALAQAEAVKRGMEPEYVFGEIGLFLVTPVKYAGYYPTPTNTSTFAATHGDFVHYGLLHIGDDVTDVVPVVMTLPMNDEHHFIVGESLWDFLCLGCEVGYFGLEQLAYQRQKTVDLLSRPNIVTMEAEERELLASLTQAFALKPWSDVKARLETLHQKYHGLLELPPDE